VDRRRLPPGRFTVCRAADLRIRRAADAVRQQPGYVAAVRILLRLVSPVDVLPALFLAVAAVVEVSTNGSIRPKGVAYACEIALGVVLVARRQSPLGVALAAAIIGTVETVSGVPMQSPWVPLAAMMVAVYTLFTRSSTREVGVGVAALLAAFALQVAEQHKGIGNFAFGVVFLAPVAVAGRTVRARTHRALVLEQEQDELAQAAAEAERRRIARELHDVISHGLGLMVLQAGAAEQALERDPEKVRSVLRSIRETGHGAIRELGTLLAVAHGELEASREPQPSLLALPRLVESLRSSGVTVELSVRGRERALPAGVELSAYRIVQEALTNVVKHAGGAPTRIELHYGERELEIVVRDSGGGTPRGGGSRRGLAGVRERVSVFGGRFHAGPGADGWELRASLPIP
jgi:signal transduction histidine kinase